MAIAERTSLASDWAEDPVKAKVAGVAALVAVGAIGVSLVRRTPRPESAEPSPSWPIPPQRRLHASAALLSASVLGDSSVEHYRAMFENPGMYAPLAVSLLSLVTGADAATARRLPRRTREGVYALAMLVGALGLGFHVYNLGRRPGGADWLNLFYAAPIGAPAALSVAGLIGLAADHVETRDEAGRPTLLGLAAGRVLAVLTSAGLLGAAAEAGLLHFRGAFQNRFMWLPVSLPPISAFLMGKAALERKAPRWRPLTGLWLALTAALGIVGVGFHAYGVSRGMGGWGNWRQNLVDGPPLPAPPSFSALALAALAALSLRAREDA